MNYSSPNIYLADMKLSIAGIKVVPTSDVVVFMVRRSSGFDARMAASFSFIYAIQGAGIFRIMMATCRF